MRYEGFVRVLLSAFTVSFCTLGFAADAGASLACGDQIGPGGHYHYGPDDLASLSDCGQDPVLEVNGPVTVDFGGAMLRCGKVEQDGIALNGTAADIQNVVVTGCDAGVVVAGQGRHVIERVVSRGNFYGFLVVGGSTESKIERSVAIHNTSDGFRTGPATAATSIVGSQALSNRANGFLLDRSERDVVETSLAQANGGQGFYVFGSSHLYLRDNVSVQNDKDGFKVESENPRLGIRDNHAHLNGGSGFVLSAPGVSMIGNTAGANDDDGIVVNGRSDLLKNNRVEGNGDRGIVVHGNNALVSSNRAFGNGNQGIVNRGNGCKFTGNRIYGNGVAGEVVGDIDEQDRTCTTNTWSNNLFGYSPVPCVE